MAKIVICIFMLLLAGCKTGIEPEAKNDVGKAPEFTRTSVTAKNTDNGNISLSELKGKVVYLYFLGYNCPPCIDAAPRTIEIDECFSDDSLQVLGLDIWDGSVTGAANFIIQSGIEYPVLTDASAVAEMYEVIQEYSVLVDKKGYIAYKKFGVNVQEIKETINILIRE